MFVYLIKYQVSDFEHFHAVLNGDGRFGIVDDSVMEAFEFCQDGVSLVCLTLGDGANLFGAVSESECHVEWPRFALNIRDFHHIGLLLKEVHGDISVFLEDTELPHILQGDAACGEVGDGTVFKLYPRGGDVGGLADDRHSVSVQRLYRGIDDGEENVDIVYGRGPRARRSLWG